MLAQVILQQANSSPNKNIVAIPIHAFPTDMRVWVNSKQEFPLAPPPAAGLETAAPVELETAVPIIQGPRLTFNTNDWSDAGLKIDRSNGGQRGAWFVSHLTRGSVVIKSQDAPHQQIMGTAFLRCMGMNAPDARMVSVNSQEGRQLSALGNSSTLDARQPTHYIIMNRVHGPNYDSLSSTKEHIQLVHDNLESLGELLIYDLLMANWDRFELSSGGFNGGNIMFYGGVLHPIDTDLRPPEEQEGFIKLALKRIATGTGSYDEKLQKKLAQNLGGPKGVNQADLPLDKLNLGFTKGLQRIVAFASDLEKNKQIYLNSCAERGCPLRRFPEHLENLVLHVKSCYKP